MREDGERDDRESSDGSDLDDNNLGVNVYADMVDLPPVEDNEINAWSEGRNKALRSALIGACKRMPRNSEAHFHLGLIFLRNGMGTEALKAFQHCKRLYNEILQKYNGEPPGKLAQHIARLQLHMAFASRMDAAALADPEEKSQLLKELQEQLLETTGVDNTRPDVWNALALLHLLEGGEQGARDILRAIHESFPDYLDVLNNLGLAESALGNEDEARKCFQEVVLKDRGHVEALTNYGVLLVQHGMFEHAIKLFEDALARSDKSRGLSFAWAGLCIARIGLGDLEKAEAAAKEAEKCAIETLDKNRMTLLVNSIIARRATDELLHGQEMAAATSALAASSSAERSSTTAKPGPRAAPSGAATQAEREAASKVGRSTLDVAVSRLRGLARDLSSSSASTALGVALRLRHEFSIEETGNRSFGAEAAERLVEALEKSQDDASAWIQLALLQMGTGEYASAREFSLQACARSEGLPASWNTLGVTSQLIDEIEDAEKAYTKALGAALARESYSPDGAGSEKKDVSESGLTVAATIWNNLGNLWRQEGAKFAEAQDAYEKSLLAGGEHPVVYNNLALLYISVGRLDEADHMLNRALRLDPNRECAVSNKLKLKVLKKMRAPPQKATRRTKKKSPQ